MKDKIIKARPLISILIILVCVGIDQLTKLLAINNLRDLADEIPVINKVFGLYYVENKGISFSMLSSKMALIIIITSIIMLILIYVMIRTPKTKYFMPFSIVLSVIVGGAAGNMIDRIFRGFVIDFIMLDFINFPIFNVADIFVCVGLFILVILIIFKYKDKDFDFIIPKKGEKVG
jgi:signal peptidase II